MIIFSISAANESESEDEDDSDLEEKPGRGKKRMIKAEPLWDSSGIYPTCSWTSFKQIWVVTPKQMVVTHLLFLGVEDDDGPAPNRLEGEEDPCLVDLTSNDGDSETVGQSCSRSSLDDAVLETRARCSSKKEKESVSTAEDGKRIKSVHRSRTDMRNHEKGRCIHRYYVLSTFCFSLSFMLKTAQNKIFTMHMPSFDMQRCPTNAGRRFKLRVPKPKVMIRTQGRGGGGNWFKKLSYFLILPTNLIFNARYHCYLQDKGSWDVDCFHNLKDFFHAKANNHYQY